MSFDLKSLGDEITEEIKSASWFPYAHGHLRDDATGGTPVEPDVYLISFDSSVASYIPYLEEGTKEHDIPFAFVGKGNWVWWYPYDDGVPFLMGMGGRFNGKFHPGSEKHKDFIKVKAVELVVNHIASKYQGEIEKL